ncbi:MAG: enoyl-CoA hydratase-related protein [Alphaproteobacteria bacterium]
MSDVLVERDGPIRTVVLNRPDRMNALSQAMWGELGRVVAEINADDSCRCIVFRGQGRKAFAAGADITEFPDIRRNAEEARAYNKPLTAAIEAIEACPHPAVAMIHGPCMGSALAIAARCDLRLAGAGARFGARISRLGSTMPVAEMRALVDLVGPTGASEILIEGRILDADDALRLGIVNRVVDDDALEAETGATVARILEGAPLVNRMHKKLLRRLRDHTPLGREDEKLGYVLSDTADYRTGISAFVAKTKPDFKGE